VLRLSHLNDPFQKAVMPEGNSRTCARFRSGVSGGNYPSIIDLAAESLSYGRFLTSVLAGIAADRRRLGAPDLAAVNAASALE
jgi:hypothetical protein